MVHEPTRSWAEVRDLAMAQLDELTLTPEERVALLEDAVAHGEIRQVAEDSRHAPVVYYVRLGTRVKIGTTANLQQRLASLPVEEFLGSEPGGVELERQRHTRFASRHVVGEWFEDCPEIRAHVAELSP